MTTTTAHTHGPNFGRREAGCPRCTELSNGAAPVAWAGTRRAQVDAQIAAESRRHFIGERHRSGGCGPVCTFGDW